jgi:hypothetical protein
VDIISIKMGNIQYSRSTGINPSNLRRIHIQIRAYGCRHTDDAALEERLLADGHGSRQDEQTLLESGAEAFWARCVARLFYCREIDLRAFLLVVITHGEGQCNRQACSSEGLEQWKRKVGKADSYLRLRREKNRSADGLHAGTLRGGLLF